MELVTLALHQKENVVRRDRERGARQMIWIHKEKHRREDWKNLPGTAQKDLGMWWNDAGILATNREPGD